MLVEGGHKPFFLQLSAILPADMRYSFSLALSCLLEAEGAALAELPKVRRPVALLEGMSLEDDALYFADQSLRCARDEQSSSTNCCDR